MNDISDRVIDERVKPFIKRAIRSIKEVNLPLEDALQLLAFRAFKVGAEYIANIIVEEKQDSPAEMVAKMMEE